MGSLYQLQSNKTKTPENTTKPTQPLTTPRVPQTTVLKPETTDAPKTLTTIVRTSPPTSTTPTTPATAVSERKNKTPSLYDLLQDEILRRRPLKSDLREPSGDAVLNYIDRLYNHMQKIHKKRMSDHKRKLKIVRKHKDSGYSGYGSGYKRKHKHKKKKKKKYPKHYHEEKNLIQEMRNIYKDMKDLYHKGSKKETSDDKDSAAISHETRSTIPTIPQPRKLGTNITPRPRLEATDIPLSPVSREQMRLKSGTTSAPTSNIKGTKKSAIATAQGTTNIKSLINEVASKVAAQVAEGIVNKHEGKKADVDTSIVPNLISEIDGENPASMNPELGAAVLKERNPALGDEEGLAEKAKDNEGSTLLETIKKLKDARNPILSGSGDKRKKFDGSRINEAVRVLEALQSPRLQGTEAPPKQNPNLDIAIKLLEKLKNPRSTARPTVFHGIGHMPGTKALSQSKVAKAVDILKELQNARLSVQHHSSEGPVLTENTRSTESPDLSRKSSKHLNSGVAKAIRLLKELDNPNLESSAPLHDEYLPLREDAINALEGPQMLTKGRNSHRFENPDLDESDSNDETIPDLETTRSPVFGIPKLALRRPTDASSDERMEKLIHSVAEEAAEKLKEKRRKQHKIPRLHKSDDVSSEERMEHLIDSVAEEAAHNVEKQLGESGTRKAHISRKGMDMPMLSEKDDEDNDTMKSKNPYLGSESKEENKSEELSDSDELGDDSSDDTDEPGSEEINEMLRYRTKMKRKKRKRVGRRKKVDIPHEGIGNDAYMIVHLGFENTNHGMIMDDSGLHNNAKMTSLTSVTVTDSKCGSALRMRGGQLLLDSKAFHGTPREAVTIAMWIKLDNINNMYNLFTTEGNGAKYTFQVADGKVHWSHQDDRGLVVFSVDTDPLVNPGDWTHLGVTYDSRTNFSKVIVNGQVVAEKQGEGKLSQNWDGKAGIGLSSGVEGVIDEFYMYNRALAASDIGDLSEQCNLGAGQAIPTKEGSYDGLIPQKVIEEAMERIKMMQSNSTSTPTTKPALSSPTTPSSTTPTTHTTATSTSTSTTTPPTTPTTSTPTTVGSTSTSSPSNSLYDKEPTMSPLAVAVGEPKCEQSLFYYNSKLRGEMSAGLFIDLGRVHVTTECVKRCCEIDSCDLVFLSRDRCYAVGCYNAKLCEPVVASAAEADVSSIYYVTRNGKSILGKYANSSASLYPPTHLVHPTLSPYFDYHGKDEDESDWESINRFLPTSNPTPPEHGYCTQNLYYFNVGLKGGLKAGEVLKNTYTGDMDKCVELCCEDRRCDVAMAREGECFTMKCAVEKCAIQDGGEFEISFVTRQSRPFKKPTIFSTSYSSPTLGVDEDKGESDSHKKFLSLYLGFDHIYRPPRNDGQMQVIDGSGLNNNARMTTGTSITAGRKGPGASLVGGDILLNGQHFRRKPRDAISLAVWIKMAVTQGVHSIFDTVGSHSMHREGQYHFEVTDGRVRWFHRDEHSRGIFAVQSQSLIEADTWYHVAVTYDSRDQHTNARAKIYINGDLKGKAAGEGKLSQDWGTKAGFGSHRGQRILFGVLDEIYMFSRALAGSEVLRYINNLQEVSGAQAFTTQPTMVPTSIVLDSFSNSLSDTPTKMRTSSSDRKEGEGSGAASSPTKSSTTTNAPSRESSTTAATTTPTAPSTTPTTSSTTTPTTAPSTTTPPTTTPTTQKTTTEKPTTRPPTPRPTTSPKSICKLGNVYRNRDLAGGLGAGNFTDKGIVESIEACMRLCCAMDNCTLAYYVRKNCFTVVCRDTKLCHMFTRSPLDLSPVLGFVNRFENGVPSNPTPPPASPTTQPTTHPSQKPTTAPSKLIPTQQSIELPSCSHSNVYHHVTLKGGLTAGSFNKLAEYSNMAECATKCCARASCDVAIMMRDTCFGLHCKSQVACETRPAHLKNFKLVMVYIYRNEPTTPTTQPSHSPTEPSLEQLLGRVQPSNSPSTSSVLEQALGTVQHTNPATPTTPNPKRPLCSQGLRVNNVILNGGMGSGEVSQYEGVSDVYKCAGKCCQSRGCHVALVIRDVCYNVKCYSRDLCRTRPLDGANNVTSNVVYVSRNGMAMFSSADEARVANAFKPTLGTTKKSIDKPSSKTTIPKLEDSGRDVPMKCTNGKTFYNVRLRGDLSAGEFTERGMVTSMSECAQLCCEERLCDLAYLLEGKCYSVHCHSRDLCQVVVASPLALNPVVSYVHRYFEDGSIQGIMGNEVTLMPPTTEPLTTTTLAPTTKPTSPPTTPTQHKKHHKKPDEEEKSERRHKTQHSHKNHDKDEHHHRTKPHHKDHPGHHQESLDKEKEEHQEFESVISHLSSADLALITSLDGTQSAAELEEMTRCKASQFGCQHYCINLLDGGHRCMCHQGYKLLPNGRDCEDRNDCQEGTYECEHICVNDGRGNHTCECRSGFILNADGKHCDDLDECALDIHGCSKTCINTRGSYKCACSNGYTLDSDRMNCRSSMENAWRKDQTEHPDRGLEIPTFIIQTPKDQTVRQGGTAVFPCKARGHPAPHIAWAIGTNGDEPLPSDDRFGLLPSGALVVKGVNITDQGMYRCVASNPAGSAARSAILQVEDLDECTIRDHECQQVCINTIGSYKCQCNGGYSLSTDGKSCDDLDECKEDTNGCDQLCHNVAGSFTCDCRTGYSLSNDLKTCADIDECSMTGHGCAQLCNNTLGGYTCGCLKGYILSRDNSTCIEHRWFDTRKSVTVTAGMAAFGALGVVSLAVVVGAIACAIKLYKKKLKGRGEDEESANKKSLFSWLE